VLAAREGVPLLAGTAAFSFKLIGGGDVKLLAAAAGTLGYPACVFFILCTLVSGGFIAYPKTGFIINGSQQQFLVRDSSIGGWSNGVWNQVFSGVIGAPPQSFSTTPYNPPPYTTLPSSPVTREKPFLQVDSAGSYSVFVPAVQRASVGTKWVAGTTPGSSIAIERFFVARPTDSVDSINTALASGKNLLLLPGVYALDQPIKVTRPDSVVLGLGFPTLVPQNGNAAMTVANAKGVDVSGVLFDEQDTGPGRGDHGQPRHDLLDHYRGEAQGQLVDEQVLRPAGAEFEVVARRRDRQPAAVLGQRSVRRIGANGLPV